MITAEQIRKFSLIFKGYEKAHGRFRINRTNEEKNKKEGAARVVHEPVSYGVWEDHLLGKSGVGLGIIMLQENDTCRFGAIDIDNPNIDHFRLVKAVAELKLPLVVCRSKSGGAHCYLFLTDDCPAGFLRDKLDEFKSALGFSKKTETFPKQISRATPEETGNWINLPYYNAERTDRYAMRGSAALNLDEFLDYVEESSITAAELKKIAVHTPQPSESDPFYEGPPCLVTIYGRDGFEEGTRNNGMYNVGVYLKKRYPDDWATKMDTYNRLMANLPATEIVTITKSVGKGKEYNYSCKQSPLADFCNRRQCLKRQFGVADHSVASAEYEITNICRLDYRPPDPPMWTFEVNGRRVLVENDQIYNVDAMNRACMSQANCIPLNINMSQWRKILNTLIQSAEVVEMPSDASPTGQLWHRIICFVQEGVPAVSKEEVFTGQVYRHEGHAYFRSNDLFQYLKTRGVRIQSEQYVWQLIKQHGGKVVVFNLRRVSGRVWTMPLENPMVDEHEPDQLVIAEDEDF